LLLTALIGCAPTFNQGWDDGCADATEQGYEWGSEDAAGCYEADNTPPPGSSGSTMYDAGWDSGYESCYPDAYDEGYNEMMDYLGEC